MNRQSKIDAIKGIAILLVVFYHFFPNIISAGYIGVDIFFVMSGYLIARVVDRPFTKGIFSLHIFYINRYLRIIPSLLLVILTIFILGYLYFFAEEFRYLNKHITSSLLFIDNYISILENGYFVEHPQTKTLLTHWSLSIEIQFYLIFPFLYILIKDYKNKIIIIFTLLIFSVFASFYLTNLNNIWGYYNFISRIAAILSGILLYFCYEFIESYSIKRPKNVIAIISLLGIIIFCLSFKRSNIYPGIIYTIPIFLSIGLMVESNSLLYKKIFHSSVLKYIGLVSYTWYLWHWTIYSFVYIFKDGQVNYFYKFLIIIFSFILSAIIFKFYENKFKNLIYFKYFIAIQFILIFTCTYIYINEGLQSRNINSNFILNNISNFLSTRKSDKSCLNQLRIDLKGAEVCITNSSTPDTLFMGDSHAMALFIEESRFNKNSMLIASSGCYPYPKFFVNSEKNFNSHCNELWPDIKMALDNINTIRYIVISNYAYKDTDIKEYYFNDNLVDNDNAFINGNSNLFNYLLKFSNLKIVFIEDFPIFDKKPINCINRSNLELKDCNISLDKLELLRSNYYKNLFKLKEKYSQVYYIDGRKYFCENNVCSFIKDGKFTYFDRDHINQAGSLLVLKDLYGRGLLK